MNTRGSHFERVLFVINQLPSRNGENFAGDYKSPVASVCSVRDWLRAEILSRFACTFQALTLKLLRKVRNANIKSVKESYLDT